VIVAIILAAGRSTRFGANKLLHEIAGKTIIRQTVEAVLASKVEAVHVVTGNQGDLIRATLANLPIEFVDNPDFSTGLSSSLRRGVKSLPAGCSGGLVVLGDMPFVPSALIDRLIDSFAPQDGRAIGVPVCGGRRGHPVLWAQRFFPEMLMLEGDKGAKQLMASYKDCVYELAVEDDAIHRDIDTKEDLPMSDLPYSTAVLRLAADAHGAGRLFAPRHSHTENNPVCGDRVTVDLHLAGGVVDAIAHDSKACVLTQASASLLSTALPGHTADQLQAARDAVAAMLLGGPTPEEDFAGYGVLAEVARHPARHRCVLLPIDAALKAFAEPEAPTP